MKKITKFLVDALPALILLGVALLCTIFIVCGTKSENGSITLDGQDAKIEDYTKKFIEDANDAIYRLMNEDAPTDQETIEANKEFVPMLEAMVKVSAAIRENRNESELNQSRDIREMELNESREIRERRDYRENREYGREQRESSGYS